jgi:hypothetical protein
MILITSKISTVSSSLSQWSLYTAVYYLVVYLHYICLL